jgi:tetratricopeptide (TPR) repeat protein
MNTHEISRSLIFKPVSAVLATLMLFMSFSTGFSQDSVDIFEKWDEVSLLRASGEYPEAIAALEGILEDYPKDEKIQRRAWNLLIHTRFKAGDEEGAMRTAREALESFPDLTVNTSILPAWMNDTYDELRSAMFGSLKVTGPEGAALYLEGDTLGIAPVSITYLRTGIYSLTAIKSGYHEISDTIRIDPSETLTMALAMDRSRNKRWWVYRVGAAVVAGTATAWIIAANSGSDEPALEPLAGPPSPP